MSLATIRAVILTTLQAIPNIGQVHNYERFAKGEKDFRALYQSVPDGPILGWHVRRVSTEQTALDVDDPDQRQDRHTWEIRGFMALSDADASELTFDALIEAIREAFRLDDTLGDAGRAHEVGVVM